MRRFDLPGLRSGDERQIEISPEDFEIATSPSVHSICRNQEQSGYNDLNNAAILEMISGGAPNLKEYFLSYYTGFNDPWSLAASYLPRQYLRPGSIRSAPISHRLSRVTRVGDTS